MGEVLGVVSSIIAILELTSEAVVYINGVKDATKETIKIRDEISSTGFVLAMLKDHAKRNDADSSWLPTLASLAVEDGPLSHFKSCLQKLTSRLKLADGVKGTVRRLTWPFRKDEVLEILGTIERQKALFNLALQNDHIALTQAIADDIKCSLAAITAKLDEVHLDQQTIQQENLQREILDWLKAPDPSVNQYGAQKTCQPSTGQWFLESEEFENFKTTPKSILWLHGIPGCGKTVLSSTIIQKTMAYCEFDTTKLVLYFYFSFNDSEKQTLESLMRSLVVQFARNSSTMRKELEELFTRHQKGRNQPTVEDLQVLLRKSLAIVPHTYLFLDALDECNEREVLLDFLAQLYEWDIHGLHILVASRRERDIEESLESLRTQKIPVRSEAVNDDIRFYIQKRLHNDKKFKKWPPNVLKEIESSLMEKSNGMFRWTVCQLDELQKCLTLHSLRTTLQQLPRTLDETYERILLSIDEMYAETVARMLKWLTLSYQPLRLEVLAEVAALNPDEDPKFQAERRLLQPLDVFHLCSSLVTGEPAWFQNINGERSESTLVRLSHFSVKEFLLSRQIYNGAASHFAIEEQKSHAYLARSCLAYLPSIATWNSVQTPEPEPCINHNSLATTASGHDGGQIVYSLNRHALHREYHAFWDNFPLFVYVLTNWEKHLHDSGYYSIIVNPAVLQFFSSPDLYTVWAIFSEQYLFQPMSRDYIVISIGSPLYFASKLGLPDIVRPLVEAGANPNNAGGQYGCSLEAASRFGHLEIVKYLIDKGASVNTVGCSPLHSAVFAGSVPVIRLLVENGADVDLVVPDYGSVIDLAAACGNSDVVDFLLSTSIDLESAKRVSGLEYNAVETASKNGHIRIAKTLIEKGFDFGLLSLVFAIRMDDAEYIEFLIQKGASINFTPEQQARTLQASPIHQACRTSPPSVVKLLVDHGADVTAASIGPTPLQCATGNVKDAEKIIRILLEAGADVNAVSSAKDSMGRTALQSASLYNSAPSVRVLLEAGADVNWKDGAFGSTALELAVGNVWGPSLAVVKLLLEAGARVDLRGFNGPPLSRAERKLRKIEKNAEGYEREYAQRQISNCKSIIALLFEYGANPTDSAAAQEEEQMWLATLSAEERERFNAQRNWE